MGSLQALEFAELTDIDTALNWHARGNHYPPLPTTLIPVWKEVINWANEGKDLDQTFALPSPATWRGNNFAPAWAIIEGHHLNAWISNDQ